MSIFFSFLALAACLSLAACGEDEEKQRRLLNEIIRRSTMNDSLKKKLIDYKGDNALLEAELDSLGKFGELLQKNNRDLYQEVKKNRQEVKNYRHNITQLQAEKQANEREIDRLGVEFAEISADRDRLTGLTQDLQKKLVYAQQVIQEVRQVQNSVRLMVGTEKLLKENGFLETGRGLSLRKRYKLVGKPQRDDPRIKLVPINQQLRLTLRAIPKALVDRSGRLKLKALVDRSGKLKEYRDYEVSESGETTIITFTNGDFLSGADVLAVVEVKN